MAGANGDISMKNKEIDELQRKLSAAAEAKRYAEDDVGKLRFALDNLNDKFLGDIREK